MTPFEIWLSGFLADKALWLTDKATGSIVSEYVKRVVFRKSAEQASKSSELEKRLARLVQKYDGLSNNAEIVLNQKEYAENEVIRIRLANQNLQNINQALQNKIEALSHEITVLKAAAAITAAVKDTLIEHRPVTNNGPNPASP